MMVLLFLAAHFDNGLEIENLGIYRPLSSRNVLLSPRGHLYIAPFQAEFIQHYDADGNRLENIGRKGKGPGEFQMLRQMFYLNDRIYLFDQQFRNGRILIFSPEGAFMESIKSPSLVLNLVKTSNGWAYFETRDMYKRESKKKHDKLKLVLTDTSFENPKILFEWKKPTMKMSGFGKNNVMTNHYNPAPDYPKLLVSKDALSLFFYKPGKFEIHVINVLKGEVIRTIERDIPRTPFNQSWGEERLEKVKKAMGKRPSRGLKIKYQPDFPEFFPGILSMTMDADDHLWVTQGSAMIDPEVKPLVLDHSGRPTHSRFSRLTTGSVIGKYKEWAYITTFDRENEEAGIKKLPVAEVNAYFERQKALREQE